MPSTRTRSAPAEHPRGVRTRAAIAEALLAIVDEGDLQPTASRIAERAGVSMRLVYHHFGDLESLYVAAMGHRLAQQADDLPPVPLGGSLEARVDAIAQRRAQHYEALTPLLRATRLLEPSSPRLSSRREEITGALLRQLRLVFAPEIAAVTRRDDAREVLAAVATSLSWQVWDTLRAAGLTAEQATRIVRRTVLALLRDATRPA